MPLSEGGNAIALATPGGSHEKRAESVGVFYLPIMPARKRVWKKSAAAPDDVYTDAAFP